MGCVWSGFSLPSPSSSIPPPMSLFFLPKIGAKPGASGESMPDCFSLTPQNLFFSPFFFPSFLIPFFHTFIIAFSSILFPFSTFG